MAVTKHDDVHVPSVLSRGSTDSRLVKSTPAVSSSLTCSQPASSSSSSSSQAAELWKAIPRTTEARLLESWSDQPIDIKEFLKRHHKQQKRAKQKRNKLRKSNPNANDEKGHLNVVGHNDDDKDPPETYLYLGYGSNMCALSFLQRRGVKPLSQANIVAPAVQLTFDLAGTPYSEPCYGNLRFRDTSTSKPPDKTDETPSEPYHKNNWHKGMVGVVYEVTASDYANIIASEGGGASYHDILVDCYTLSSDPSVPVPDYPPSSSPSPSITTTTTTFVPTACKAHALYSTTRYRTDPAYAQCSARYLKLLTDGGAEHDLPTEYRAYMAQIRTYTRTTAGQNSGMALIAGIWTPLSIAMGAVGKMFINADGTYPEWFARFLIFVHVLLWTLYDRVLVKVFGDGERSIADGGKGGDGDGKEGKDGSSGGWSEKVPLLEGGRNREHRSQRGGYDMV